MILPKLSATSAISLRILFLLTLILIVFGSGRAAAINQPGEELADIKISTTLGTQVDLALKFTDSSGRAVQLREVISPNLPVIVTPVYYKCRSLCGLLINGFIALLEKLDLKLGRDYRIITVSFNSAESPTLAHEKSQTILKALSGTIDSLDGWSFLVGNEESVSSLMRQLGFAYQRDGEDISHSPAIFVLTPNGKISQYFTGIDFSPRDVRLSLVEASNGSIGNIVDHVFLYCFRFDATKGQYTFVAFNALRIGGVLTLLAMGTFLYFSLRRA